MAVPFQGTEPMADLCYVCNADPLESFNKTPEDSLVYRVTCQRCGTYDIAHKLIAGDKDRKFLTENNRLRLSHAIRRATDTHERFAEAILNYETVKQLADQHPLPDPIEQADLLIDSIARRCSYGDFTTPESVEIWAARIGLKGVKQLEAMQKDLASFIRQSGLSVMGRAIPGGPTTVGFTLTLEGWKRAREIQQQRGSGNQAFVAMWFHPDMLAAYTVGFMPALTDTGHTPYRVDFAAHNNKIDDEIIAEIRRSKLVIVDTTGARPNTYYEAGFAKGLGIPVLWCCNESWQGYVCEAAPNSTAAPEPMARRWTDILAFDTRQHAFIFWSDPTDLRKKLTDRIRALGFDAAWNRQ